MSRTGPRGKNGKEAKADPATRAFTEGLTLVKRNPALGAVDAKICRQAKCSDNPAGGLAVVTSNGMIHVHPTRRAEPAEWAWTIAHALLHLGFGHVPAAADRRRPQPDRFDVAARCAVVNRFLLTFPVGRAPDHLPAAYPGGDEELLAARWRRDGIPAAYEHCGTAGDHPDQVLASWNAWQNAPVPDWQTAFAHALTRSVSASMEVAGGRRDRVTGERVAQRPWDRALNWFVSSYPLLGGLAAGLTVVADAELARSQGIAVAAVSATAGRSTSTRCAPSRTRNGGSSWPTRCCTPPCATAGAAAPGTRTCTTWPPTTWSTAGSWRWASARCRPGCCTTRR